MPGIFDFEPYPATPSINDELKLKIHLGYLNGLDNLLQMKVGKSIRSLVFDKAKFTKASAEKWIKDRGVNLSDVTEDEKFVYAGVRKFSDFTETDVFEKVGVAEGIEVLVKAMKPEVLQILKDKAAKEATANIAVYGYISGEFDAAKLAEQLGVGIGVAEVVSVAPSGKLSVTKNENGVASFTMDIPVEKYNEDQHIVVGVVYQPDIVDAQGDSASAEEIEKACDRYNQDSKTLGIMHREGAGDRASILQSYIAPADFKLGKGTVRRGSWIMKIKIHDEELWKMIKEDKITGLSMGGRARAA